MSKNAARLFILMLTLIVTAPLAQAEVLFESFYRLESKTKHIGYVVQRRWRDSTGQEVIASYIRVRGAKGEMSTTSKAVSEAKSGAPISSAHTKSGAAPVRIEATFKNHVGKVSTFYGKSRVANLVETSRPAPYMSSFLFFIGDLTKIQPAKRYSYLAFAEESGRSQIGFIHLASSQMAGERKILQVINDDSAQPIENFVAENGEPLGSRSEATGFVAFWVPGRAEAIGDLAFPQKDLIALFGDIPVGKKNTWSAIKNLNARETIKNFPGSDDKRQAAVPQGSITLQLPLRSL